MSKFEANSQQNASKNVRARHVDGEPYDNLSQEMLQDHIEAAKAELRAKADRLGKTPRLSSRCIQRELRATHDIVLSHVSISKLLRWQKNLIKQEIANLVNSQTAQKPKHPEKAIVSNETVNEVQGWNAPRPSEHTVTQEATNAWYARELSKITKSYRKSDI